MKAIIYARVAKNSRKDGLEPFLRTLVISFPSRFEFVKMDK